jgi:hypothetical protein
MLLDANDHGVASRFARRGRDVMRLQSDSMNYLGRGFWNRNVPQKSLFYMARAAAVTPMKQNPMKQKDSFRDLSKRYMAKV